MHDNPTTQKHFQLQQLYFWTPKISFNKIIKLHANLFPVMCANSVLPLCPWSNAVDLYCM